MELWQRPYGVIFMKTTREGKRFTLAAFLIAVAAINTGNNLIYLILSLMISFLLLSVLLLKINLSGLMLEVYISSPLFAGRESTAVFSITNKKRFIPSYSLRVSADTGFSNSYYNLIPSSDKVRREITVMFLKRGVYSYGNFYVRSGFPFILLEDKRSLKVSGEILVYPPLIDVDGIVPEISGPGIADTIRLKGSDGDVYSIREFGYGDDWHKIHWKASARASALLVREFAEQEFRRMTVVIDNLMPAEQEIFEKAVSLSASISKLFIEMGFHVRLLSCKKVIPFGNGDEHLFRILDTLAVIKEEDVWECPVSYNYDTDGISILVLKNQGSRPDGCASSCEIVIYADTI
jgi:uncharacterized protein (DUF58 family)